MICCAHNKKKTKYRHVAIFARANDLLRAHQKIIVIPQQKKIVFPFFSAYSNDLLRASLKCYRMHNKIVAHARQKIEKDMSCFRSFLGAAMICCAHIKKPSLSHNKKKTKYDVSHFVVFLCGV